MDYTASALDFLDRKVRIRSVSFEEDRCADFIQGYLTGLGLEVERIGNNLLVRSSRWLDRKPVLMLNSHIDTVQPSQSYTFDATNPPLDNERIFGLGSNDAGGSVSSLLHTFLYFEYENVPLSHNLLLLLSCEEERSGKGGISRVLEEQPHISDLAIIGEPTGMRAAIAERGLLVVDAVAEGVSGHAAREEGVNAIYKAMDDIALIHNLSPERISPVMGKVKMTVTQINAGYVHNIVPDKCEFVIDIRPTECYTNPEIMEILEGKLSSKLKARNLTNRSSATPADCPLLRVIDTLGIEKFVSPTTSDWMRLGSIPAIKIGPGESSRSHKADEYIYKSEIADAIGKYINIIKAL